RTEAAKARGTARGADHRLSGLQEEMALRTRRGRQHVDVEEPAAPESSYTSPTATDFSQPSPPLDIAEDAPPL
ncbi:hypothetical protein, partial [Streptomyces sp. NPDC087294]|uniref:hypothetical protein n=1 Tax=Streptomyces sp. NPDC087294 TaxID=3365777 RepID=UPI0037FCE7B9